VSGRNFTVLTERQQCQLARRHGVPSVQYWGVADGEPERLRGGYFMPGQNYSDAERATVLTWMFERWNGYPNLKRFEGGKCWPYPLAKQRSIDEGAYWPGS
jgi:hypothetical protein